MTVEQSLAVRPLRAVEATVQVRDDETATLTVPLKQSRWTGWFFKMPDGAHKKFELDKLGLFVWNHCDGKTSVKQLIRKLARQFQLNERMAEVSTIQFLRTLGRKGLIAMSLQSVREQPEGK